MGTPLKAGYLSRRYMDVRSLPPARVEKIVAEINRDPAAPAGDFWKESERKAYEQKRIT